MSASGPSVQRGLEAQLLCGQGSGKVIHLPLWVQGRLDDTDHETYEILRKCACKVLGDYYWGKLEPSAPPGMKWVICILALGPAVSMAHWEVTPQSAILSVAFSI